MTRSSPISRSGMGGPPGGSSSLNAAGCQKLRRNAPHGVPGPTRVRSSFSSLLSMSDPLDGADDVHQGGAARVERRADRADEVGRAIDPRAIRAEGGGEGRKVRDPQFGADDPPIVVTKLVALHVPVRLVP